MCKSYLVLLLVAWSFSSFSQSDKRKLRVASEEANGAYEEKDYETALTNYLVVDSLTPDDAILSYRIGVCQRELYLFEDAIASFNKSIQLGYTYNDINLMKAKTHHLAHDFELAEQEYIKYKDSLDVNSDSYKDTNEEVEKYINQCHVGNSLKANPFEIELLHLDTNINSPYAEYAPLISSDECLLFYTSRKPSGDDKPDLNGLYHEHIYQSTQIKEKWSHSKKLQGINKTKNDACVGLSPDGTQMILYRNNHLVGEAGDLYLSKQVTEDDSTFWSTPKSLGSHINSTHWEPSASITADHNTIYFVSNRPGGFGGTDIYVSHKNENGNWGKAENLGSTVNTKYDEDSPFINNDVLYFSSKGHEGMGGFDLFMSVNLLGEWLEPMNFGYPINSAKDDFHFVWNHNGTRGYFSSARKDSYGKSDIYVIVRPFDDPNMVYVKGTMTDETNNEAIVNAQISLIDSLGDIISDYTTDSLGHYKLAAEMGKSYTVKMESEKYASVEYQINVPKKNYYFEVKEDVITITKEEKIKREPKVDEKEREKTLAKIELPVVLTDQNISDQAKSKEPLQSTNNFSSQSIYFASNHFKLSPNDKTDLNSIAKQLKAIHGIIEISGHTDKVGSSNYNEKLSKKRAQSVADYLISKGVSSKNIIVIGFGKDKPASDNHDKNRRVEISLMD